MVQGVGHGKVRYERKANAGACVALEQKCAAEFVGRALFVGPPVGSGPGMYWLAQLLSIPMGPSWNPSPPQMCRIRAASMESDPETCEPVKSKPGSDIALSSPNADVETSLTPDPPLRYAAAAAAEQDAKTNEEVTDKKGLQHTAEATSTDAKAAEARAIAAKPEAETTASAAAQAAQEAESALSKAQDVLKKAVAAAKEAPEGEGGQEARDAVVQATADQEKALAEYRAKKVVPGGLGTGL